MDALAWIALAILGVVALLGFTMFFIWAGQRQRASGTVEAHVAGSTAAEPAEQHFPVAIVAVHGMLAVATVILVLLTAAGVGGS
jgi:heme/copper-type cytochrome/quinol oxidase subunit 2